MASLDERLSRWAFVSTVRQLQIDGEGPSIRDLVVVADEQRVRADAAPCPFAGGPGDAERSCGERRGQARCDDDQAPYPGGAAS